MLKIHDSTPSVVSYTLGMRKLRSMGGGARNRFTSLPCENLALLTGIQGGSHRIAILQLAGWFSMAPLVLPSFYSGRTHQLAPLILFIPQH